MPTYTTTYRVLLSMPSDLENELECVDNVIDELNLSWGKPNNKQIELVHWSRYAIPGASIGSIQNLINKELGTNFDLYIGILWKRFGTQTDNAESGTEEEFNVAYSNFLKNPNATQILFYFCDIPFTLDEIDFEQLQKVQKFKKRLIDDNIYFKSYKRLDELAQLLRMHIPIRLDSLLEIIPNESIEEKELVEDSILNEAIQEINEEVYSEDDWGLLEYREEFDSLIAEYISSIGRVTKAMETIGKRTETKTRQLISLQANPNSGTTQYRNLFRGLAKYMDDYTNSLEGETTICFPAFSKAMNAALQLLNLSIVEEDGLNELIEQRESVSNLYGAMEGSIQSMIDFLRPIQELPKLTTELNKARKRLILTQQTFNDNLIRSKDMIQEVIYAHDEKIRNLQLKNASHLIENQ